jgi:hypothetical protein
MRRERPPVGAAVIVLGIKGREAMQGQATQRHAPALERSAGRIRRATRHQDAGERGDAAGASGAISWRGPVPP